MNQSTHFDPTDGYVALSGRSAWANSKTVELYERMEELRKAGKPYGFTDKLRSFLIHANDETILEIMLAWGSRGPFYDSNAKAKIKQIMEKNQ